MIRAVEKVRARLERAVAALEGAGIPYAIAGGNAVAAWVSRVDEAAVRYTKTSIPCCGVKNQQWHPAEAWTNRPSFTAAR
jgi:hypothetical protein